MDRALPMGCSISCTAFECFSLVLELVLKHWTGMAEAVHYLGDYLFCGKRSTNLWRRLMAAFQEMTRVLGVPLAKEKMDGPAMALIYLGIELDTVQQFSQLPEGLSCRVD